MRLAGPRAYVDADLSRSNGYNAHESNLQGRLMGTYSDGGTWWRASGSLFGYGGTYRASGEQDSSVRGDLAYYGAGFLSSLGLGVPLKGFTTGVGATVGIAFESGEYSKVWITPVTGSHAFLAGGYYFLDVTVADSHHIGFSAHTGLPGFNSLSLHYFFDHGYIRLGCGDAYHAERDQAVFGERSIFGRVTLGGGLRVY